KALEALEHGLAERTVVLGGMGTAGLFESVATVNKERPAPSRRYEPLSKELIEYIKSAWQSARKDATALRPAMRAGMGEATTAVVAEVAAPGTSAERRCVLLGLLAASGAPEGLPAALGLLDERQPITVQAAALDVVAGHGDAAVTSRLLAYYAKSPPAV